MNVQEKKLKSYWRDSISLFINPNELKTFILLTLNNSQKAFINTLFYCWPIIITCLVLSYFLHNIFLIILPFFYILASRESIETKNSYYFFTYSIALPAYLLFRLPAYYISYTYLFFLNPFFECFAFSSVLFYLDSQLNPYDIILILRKTYLFFIYFLPFILIISSLCFMTATAIPAFLCLTGFLWPLSFYFFTTLAHLWYIISGSILISALVIYYIKVKHTYPSIFFK